MEVGGELVRRRDLMRELASKLADECEAEEAGGKSGTSTRVDDRLKAPVRALLKALSKRSGLIKVETDSLELQSPQSAVECLHSSEVLLVSVLQLDAERLEAVAVVLGQPNGARHLGDAADERRHVGWRRDEEELARCEERVESLPKVGKRQQAGGEGPVHGRKQ